MTQQELNPIIAKIEKLMRLARNQDGTHEGETAAKLASRMMAAHAIDMASIDVDRAAEHDPMEQQSIQTRSSVWRRLLANAIAQHCNCRMAYLSGHHIGQTLHIYGHRTDIELMKYLYSICERQIENQAREYTSQFPAGMPGKRTLGNNFRRSAVDGLRHKLYHIRKDAERDNVQGFALVRSRSQAVSEWVDSNFSFGSAKASSEYGHSAAGYDAGKSMNLSAGIDSQGNTKKLRGE